MIKIIDVPIEECDGYGEVIHDKVKCDVNGKCPRCGCIGRDMRQFFDLDEVSLIIHEFKDHYEVVMQVGPRTVTKRRLEKI